jgi:ADP-heptose:LPS heptosyltransferase
MVQLGAASDPPLANVRDLRGRTTIREAAAVLAGSRLFIGMVGFLMHLARAVGTRSVIVYGGREHPSQSGYRVNTNLFTELPCSPCWYWNRCPYDRECMRRITAADVIAAGRAALS